MVQAAGGDPRAAELNEPEIHDSCPEASILLHLKNA